MKNVVVLGGSYSGARAAELLSKTLPNTHRVILIDRQSHFNHLYLFPRVGVVPGHAHKVFIPFTGVLASPANPPPATLPPIAPSDLFSDKSSSAKAKHLNSTFVNASVVKIGPGYIDVDRDLDQDTFITDLLERQGITDREAASANPHRRIKWEYLIYALGCTLPPPLVSPARTKLEGVAFLQAQQQRISAASSILIAGGGALGIQYATDIADLFNNPENEHLRPPNSRPGPKKVTLVHSRDRFLPLYKQEMHDEILGRLKSLGVRVIMGERLDLPTREEEAAAESPEAIRQIVTRRGEVIEFDLLLRCTGQKPNSELLKGFMPKAITEAGYVKVKDTMQVDDPNQSDFASRVYAIGDVAATAAIRAGHVGWNQAGIVVGNIISSIMCDSSELHLTKYEPSVPQIKVTLGLRHSASELLPSMDATETDFAARSDGALDGGWNVVWSRMGVDSSDPLI